jgi:hypothetical protein
MQLLVEAKENRADLYISGDITRGVQFWGMTFKNDTDVEYNDVAEVVSSLSAHLRAAKMNIDLYDEHGIVPWKDGDTCR